MPLTEYIALGCHCRIPIDSVVNTFDTIRNLTVQKNTFCWCRQCFIKNVFRCKRLLQTLASNGSFVSQLVYTIYINCLFFARLSFNLRFYKFLVNQKVFIFSAAFYIARIKWCCSLNFRKRPDSRIILSICNIFVYFDLIFFNFYWLLLICTTNIGNSISLNLSHKITTICQHVFCCIQGIVCVNFHILINRRNRAKQTTKRSRSSKCHTNFFFCSKWIKRSAYSFTSNASSKTTFGRCSCGLTNSHATSCQKSHLTSNR